MLCVVALICSINADHPRHRVDGLLHLVGLHQHVVHAVLQVLTVHRPGGTPPRLI